MRTIHYVTTNLAKVESLQLDLKDLDVQVEQVSIDIPESRSPNPTEIAREKAHLAFQKLGKPVVTQDGGFFISALNGFPGTFIRHAYETIGLEGILKLMKDEPDRSCEFRDTLAYMDETLDEPIVFEAISTGVLANEPRGELSPWNWGKLHFIFIADGDDKTFAEMTEEEFKISKVRRKNDWLGTQFANWLQTNKK